MKNIIAIRKKTDSYGANQVILPRTKNKRGAWNPPRVRHLQNTDRGVIITPRESVNATRTGFLSRSPSLRERKKLHLQGTMVFMVRLRNGNHGAYTSTSLPVSSGPGHFAIFFVKCNWLKGAHLRRDWATRECLHSGACCAQGLTGEESAPPQPPV